MNVNNSLIEFSLELCLLHFEQGGKNRNGKKGEARLIDIAHTPCDAQTKATDWLRK